MLDMSNRPRETSKSVSKGDTCEKIKNKMNKRDELIYVLSTQDHIFENFKTENAVNVGRRR